MKLTYPTTAPVAYPSALASTLYIWLFSNLGGTAKLLVDFGFDEPQDLQVPLLIGLLASVASLVAVPFALPIFVLAQRACTSWKCRLTALAGVLLAFAAANYLLLHWLPLGPPESLLRMTWPYLAGAVLTVAWLYWPQSVAGRLARPRSSRPAPLLSAWRQRAAKQPMTHLAH
ncbi:hypothetical protein Q5H92_11065 [Hymenobacter sp. M29]|uniref:Uncharacterized protein n=1 Tax=Hymenobacter mellowenesis TaxID=3063995 RepID=A0ABT9AAP0_9BACT|nr:hypothetical protein [Hymenobacter sp. M29]MDO7846899.1 hypothetical protein [Hymenobacter sp. M29]